MRSAFAEHFRSRLDRGPVFGNLPPAVIRNRSDDFQQLDRSNPQQDCWHIEIKPQSDRLLDFPYGVWSRAMPKSSQAKRRTRLRKNVSFQLLGTDQLKPNPDNPRKHSRAQVQAIARSIQAFGFNSPILIDKNKQIIAGHGRYAAALLLGLSEVPVISVEHLSEAQSRAYMLADNKLSDRSSWNDEALALHLKELSDLALDFEIEATGFEPPEIDLRIQSLDTTPEDAADDFEIATGPVVSKPGDLWFLRTHRLLCGSALDLVAYRAI
jgi:hypothetical protein